MMEVWMIAVEDLDCASRREVYETEAMTVVVGCAGRGCLGKNRRNRVCEKCNLRIISLLSRALHANRVRAS